MFAFFAVTAVTKFSSDGSILQNNYYKNSSFKHSMNALGSGDVTSHTARTVKLMFWLARGARLA